ncbi:MAG: heavy-metal-associated domain-containing protein, partial [Rhodobacteraceae bacterium]|nr:heavy-metal-associated domain-containing protein [Paracoccaceae bacterium]
MAVMTALTIAVDKMHCAGCAGRVEKAVRAAPGVTEAAVNLASKTLHVDFAAPASVADIAERLDKAGYPARRAEVGFDIDNMSCASCVARVERALGAVPGVLAAEVNFAAKSARVRYLEGQVSEADLAQTLARAGYPGRRASGSDRTAGVADRDAAEAQDLTRALWLAAALA